MTKFVILGSCRFHPYEILAVPEPIEGLHNTDEGYKQAFEMVFKEAIEQADIIILYNPEGIGEHTQKDLDYATSLRKHIIRTHLFTGRMKPKQNSDGIKEND